MFAALVALLLGPSLSGQRVALPLDLLQAHEPWAGEEPVRPANVELRDQIDTYYPVQHQLVDRIRAGEGAEWLHDLGIGLPGAPFVGWGLWSPFNAPAAALPFHAAWAWGMALRLFAAMAGAYLLARTLGGGRLGGTVAGMAFGLSGFMVLWLGWPQSHVAAAIPWTLWGVHHTMRRDSPWWAGPALALSVAALWLGGFPAVAAYALLAAGAVAAHDAWSLRHAGRRFVAFRLWSCLVAVGIGTGLAAFTLLPSLAILGEFSLGYRDQAWTTSLPPRALLTFLVPGLFGDVVHDRLWLGVSYVESVAYVGLPTLGLAAAAWLVRPRPRRLGLYTGIAGLSLALVYGLRPLQWLLSLVPLLRGNVPTRALALVCLALAILGGLGADALARALSGEAATRRRDRLTALGVALVAALAALAWRPQAWLRDLAHQRLAADRIPDAAAAAVRATLEAAGVAVLALAVVALAFALARRRPGTAQGVLGAGLVGVLAVDLVAFGGGWNVQADPALLFPDAPRISALAAASPRHRVAGADGVGLPNTHLEYGFADVRAHGFQTRRQDQVLRRLGARRPSPTVWDLRSADSGRWQPWLQAMGVSTVLTGDVSDRLGGVLVQPGSDRVADPVWGETTLGLDSVAPRDGTLDGVMVRLGTYGRRNQGELVVEVAGPSGRASGRLPLADAVDLRWAFVPIGPLPVRESDRLRVEIRSTSPGPHSAVTLFGTGHSGDFRPALAVHYEEPAGARPLSPRSAEPDADVHVIDLPAPVPVVRAVPRALVAGDGGALSVMERLGAHGLHATAVVEPYRGQPLPPLPDGGTAEVLSWARAGGKVTARVHSSGGAVLVTLDQSVRGWSALVDGSRAPVVVADHLFTGVVVPAGTHEVELRYQAPFAALGRLSAGRSLGALGAWALLRLVRHRTGMSGPELARLGWRRVRELSRR